MTSFRLLLVTLLGIAALARGDGKVLGSKDISTWLPVLEDVQHAYLSLDDGTERMLVGISIDAPPNAVWLLPVRASAADVKIDLINWLPRLAGTKPSVDRKQALETIGTVIRATLIVPFIVEGCLLPSLGRGRVEQFGGVERYGLRTELLQSDSPDHLRDYLAKQGASVQEKDLASFAPYFDGKHCFVATWVKDPDQLANQRRIGVAVTFPSTELWYPMRATAGYGDAPIRVVVLASGFVEVAARGAITEVDVDHFVDWKPGADVAKWLGMPVTELAYTRVIIDSPASAFTEDLTFRIVPGPGIESARFLHTMNRYALLIGAAAIVLASAGSGLFASRACGGTWRAGFRLGLTGSLTIVALHYALNHHHLSSQPSIPAKLHGRFLLNWALGMLAFSGIFTSLAYMG